MKGVGVNMFQLIGVFGGAMIVLVPIVKWFINDWAKKSEALEKLRAKRISKIEEESQEVRKCVNQLKYTINEHARLLGSTESRMKQLNEKIDSTMKSLDSYVNNLQANVKTEVRTQILQLSKDLQMIKTRKGTVNGK